MAQRTFLPVAVCTLILVATRTGLAGEAKGPAGRPKLTEAQQNALKLVRARLEELKAPEAHVEAMTASPVVNTFPTYSFVSVRFRLWPVAMVPPAPLKSQNLFVVGKDGKPQHLTDSKGLEPFFKAHLDMDRKTATPGQALNAWLLLTKEFVQDGFYTFVLSKERKGGAAQDGPSFVWGAIEVKPEGGNKGRITATLHFDKAGKLTRVEEENKVVRGVRPRCQATRLLDPDPVIRAICEDSLLVLGRAGREYLLEQRATASPELRREIDRIWQRILAEGR
jgi:hypothetical protein